VNVYISCHHPDPANGLADAVEAAGHNVCSLWHRDPSPRPAPDAVAEWADKAAHNVNMIIACDVHVTINSPTKHKRIVHEGVEGYFGAVPGGKHRESGIAQGLGKRVAVVGPVENGMQYHQAVRRFDDTAAFLAWLNAGAA